MVYAPLIVENCRDVSQTVVIPEGRKIKKFQSRLENFNLD